MRNYKQGRKSRQSSYSAYVEYYNELVEKSPGMFRPMYDYDEFMERYEWLQSKGIVSRTACKLAECQRYMPYFVQRYFGIKEVKNEEEAVKYIQRYLEETGDLND